MVEMMSGEVFSSFSFYFSSPEASSTMRALQRALASVIITLSNDSELSLNKKWLRPVTNKSNPQLVGNQSETPSYLPFKLLHFIHPHKEAYIIIPKSNLKIFRA